MEIKLQVDCDVAIVDTQGDKPRRKDTNVYTSTQFPDFVASLAPARPNIAPF